METKELSQEVIDQIKSIQQKNQAVEIELGQIELVKLAVKQRRAVAEQFLAELREEEATLGQFLQNEYGDGTIDIEQGVFVPSKPQQ